MVPPLTSKTVPIMIVIIVVIIVGGIIAISKLTKHNVSDDWYFCSGSDCIKCTKNSEIAGCMNQSYTDCRKMCIPPSSRVPQNIEHTHIPEAKQLHTHTYSTTTHHKCNSTHLDHILQTHDALRFEVLIKKKKLQHLTHQKGAMHANYTRSTTSNGQALAWPSQSLLTTDNPTQE